MRSLTVLGLMSGTSMDGLDCGLFKIELSKEYILSWKIIDYQTCKFSKVTHNKIRAALYGNENHIQDTDEHLGKIFVSFINKFIQDKNVDLISMHGQTISHIDGISSMQIGNPKFIFDKYNIPVVYNFRQADIEVGGNGAPLMPFLDWLLFKNKKVDIITLNIGGIANLSFIPASGKKEDVIGFDTGPGMALIDEICQKDYGVNMDNEGKFSAKGNVQKKMLKELMKNKFINREPPKSTGRHEFGIAMIEEYINKFPLLNTKDMLRTFCLFTAKSISENLKKYINFNPLNSHLIISGGGIYNKILMSDLKKNINITNFKIADEYGIKSTMKESLLMAVLGVARIKDIPANMPSVSGAMRETILGDIYDY